MHSNKSVRHRVLDDQEVLSPDDGGHEEEDDSLDVLSHEIR